MRVLIVCYSFTGNNRLLAGHLADHLVAGHLADHLGADLVEVSEVRERRGITILLDLLLRRHGRIMPLAVDASDYDQVLFIAPLWDRHIATPMRAAMRQLSPKLGPYAFVSLCGGDRGRQIETVKREATAATGRAPEHCLTMWVENQRPVTTEDFPILQDRIDTILSWFGRDMPKRPGVASHVPQ